MNLESKITLAALSRSVFWPTGSPVSQAAYPKRTSQWRRSAPLDLNHAETEADRSHNTRRVICNRERSS
jgi:hypothetical protein